VRLERGRPKLVRAGPLRLASDVDGKRHLPGLDGLRGVSIAMVLLGHLSFGAGSPRWAEPLAPIATVGVAIFFVLSGYLITTLLVQERARNGRIWLRGFYLRRALRIVPASYVYVGLIALLAGLRVLTLQPHDILCALFYVTDYHHDRAWFLGHYWSLSVEEQFYLVWPPLLAALSDRSAAVGALVLLVLAEVVPTVVFGLFPSWNRQVQLPTGAAPLAIGCLLALGFDRLAALRFWRSPAWPIALGFIAGVQVHLLDASRRIHGMQLAIHLLAAVVILRSVNVRDDLLAKILESRVLVTLGALSYSLYIWQQLFLGAAGRHWWTIFPVNLLGALAAAVASHVLIERPFLRLKERFAT
jgi:peptidoglycan/LPS O-acetylase OafA/YrhL